MTNPTHDVDTDDMKPFDPEGEAASSTVGPSADDEVEPPPGIDPMHGETGGLAGTSR